MGLDGFGVSHRTDKHGMVLHTRCTEGVVCAARRQDQVIIRQRELPFVWKIVKGGSATADLLLKVNVFDSGLDVSDFPSLMADR